MGIFTGKSAVVFSFCILDALEGDEIVGVELK